MRVFRRLSGFAAALALAVAMTMAAVDFADARSGGSFGSRGSKTYQSPAPTTTAPGATQPIQRSTTPYTQQNTASAPAAGRGGLFGNGLGGALMRGLLIGGLVGLLFGGGLGGFAGFLGLLLQAGLLALLVMFALRYFARRREPAMAGYGRPLARDALGGSAQGMGVPQGGAPAAPRQRDEVGLKPADFDMFERLLAEVQDAFSREDRAKLGTLVTPEVLSYLDEELRANAARGVRNQVSEVKLLQGDLSEAWREGALDYATVAMRYQARDTLRDLATGALAPGSTDAVRQSTEVWTFIRPRGAPWKLSAIQEA